MYGGGGHPLVRSRRPHDTWRGDSQKWPRPTSPVVDIPSGPHPPLARAFAGVDELTTLRLLKDSAYAERNQCVAALAWMAIHLGWAAGVGEHEGEDWESDWRTLLFIETPAGQLSWHFHASERHLLEGLPRYEGKWDGHDTAEKYRRLREAWVGQ